MITHEEALKFAQEVFKMTRSFLNREQRMLPAFVKRLFHRARKQQGPLKDVAVPSIHSGFISPKTGTSYTSQIHRLC